MATIKRTQAIILIIGCFVLASLSMTQAISAGSCITGSACGNCDDGSLSTMTCTNCENPRTVPICFMTEQTGCQWNSELEICSLLPLSPVPTVGSDRSYRQ